MLTRSEAKGRLVAAFPGRSVCVVVEDWHHTDVERPDHIGYRVSVLPGWDGSKCSTVTGRTLEGVVSQALEMKPPAALPTSEEADRHFAADDTLTEAGAAAVPSL